MSKEDCMLDYGDASREELLALLAEGLRTMSGWAQIVDIVLDYLSPEEMTEAKVSVSQIIEEILLLKRNTDGLPRKIPLVDHQINTLLVENDVQSPGNEAPESLHVPGKEWEW